MLRDGALIATMSEKGTTPAQLADLMVGRPLTDFYPPKTAAPTGDPVFEVDRFGRTSFAVRAGEIVGLAGLVGAGRTELAEAIFGATPPLGWEVRVNGSPCRIRSPKEAMKHGIAYVSEDRKGVGLHLSLSVIDNITLANLRAYGDFMLSRQQERQAAGTWKQELDIRAGDLEDAVVNVSGGNQQKIAIAKWLDTKPKVLVLDEPTRGVDVGAKREIYNLIQRLAGEGMACIIISSELPEVIGLCHRALVMRENAIVGELAGDQLTEEGVMRLAAGVAA